MIRLMESIIGTDDIDTLELTKMKKQGTLKFRILTKSEMDAHIKSCEPLAYSLANKFSVQFKHLRDEFTSEALLSLTRAATAFDPTKGVKFSTFCHHYIWRDMLTMYNTAKKGGFSGNCTTKRQAMSIDGELSSGDLIRDMIPNRVDEYTSRDLEAKEQLACLRQTLIDLGLWEQDDDVGLDMMLFVIGYRMPYAKAMKRYQKRRGFINNRIKMIKRKLRLAAQELQLLETL